MIILPDQHAIFVHIFKTGGSSITHALAPHTRPPFRQTAPRREGPGWQEEWHLNGAQHDKYHSDIVPMLAQMGLDAADFSVCTFVRHPYDWSLSVWSDFYRTGDSPGALSFAYLFPDRSFPDYLKYMKACSLGVNPEMWGAASQTSFIREALAEDKRLFIGRFEDYDREFERLFSFIGAPSPSVPHVVASDFKRDDYMAFFNAESIALANDLYREDFDTLGYIRIE